MDKSEEEMIPLRLVLYFLVLALCFFPLGRCKHIESDLWYDGDGIVIVHDIVRNGLSVEMLMFVIVFLSFFSVVVWKYSLVPKIIEILSLGWVVAYMRQMGGFVAAGVFWYALECLVIVLIVVDCYAVALLLKGVIGRGKR